MNEANSFRTKTGYCHVLKDKIILTREGVLGDIAQTVHGNRINRILIVYGLLSLFMISLAIFGFMAGEIQQALFFLVLSLFLIYIILISRKNSVTPIIGRSSIQKVIYKKAAPGATRAHFIIHFDNGDGKMRKRLILLPGSINGGAAEAVKAVEIFEAENLL